MVEWIKRSLLRSQLGFDSRGSLSFFQMKDKNGLAFCPGPALPPRADCNSVYQSNIRSTSCDGKWMVSEKIKAIIESIEMSQLLVEAVPQYRADYSNTWYSTIATFATIGLHSTEVAFTLLTQRPRVQISSLPKFFRWSFESSALRKPLRLWTRHSDPPKNIEKGGIQHLLKEGISC